MNHFTPEMNDGKHVFVFGSNRQGIHGAGAASMAKKHWGAKEFFGNGRIGMSYAIPTREISFGRFETLSMFWIEKRVKEFLDYATVYPELVFLVTKIGCGLAGHSEDEIKELFKDAPVNCILPDGWRDE